MSIFTFTFYRLQFTLRLPFTIYRLQTITNRKQTMENVLKTESVKQLMASGGGD